MYPLEAALELVTLAQAAALRPEQWNDFARRLESQIGAWVWLNGVPGVSDGTVAPSLPDRSCGLYGGDPGFAQLREAVARDLAPGEVRRVDELLPSETLLQLRARYDAEHVRWSQSLVLRIGSEQPPAMLIALWPPSMRCRIQRATHELSLLATPLAHAFQTAARIQGLQELEAMWSGLRVVVDRLPVSVFLMQPVGRVLVTNAPADSLLRERDGLVMTPEGLRGSTFEGTLELRELLWESEDHAGGFAATLLPRGSGRAPLHALARSLRARARSMVVMLIRDPERTPELRTELLRRFYHLTPAEAELARVLAQGRDLHEAAEVLGVTRHTVRSRLQDLFSKTGTSRQAALVERLLLDVVLEPGDGATPRGFA